MTDSELLAQRGCRRDHYDQREQDRANTNVLGSTGEIWKVSKRFQMVCFRGSTQEKCYSEILRFGSEKAANDPAVADDGRPLLVLGRKGVAAQMGEPDRAIAALQKLLSIPYEAALVSAPVTPALLRLDPMFDPLRKDPRFQQIVGNLRP